MAEEEDPQEGTSSGIRRRNPVPRPTQSGSVYSTSLKLIHADRLEPLNLRRRTEKEKRAKRRQIPLLFNGEGHARTRSQRDEWLEAVASKRDKETPAQTERRLREISERHARENEGLAERQRNTYHDFVLDPNSPSSTEEGERVVREDPDAIVVLDQAAAPNDENVVEIDDNAPLVPSGEAADDAPLVPSGETADDAPLASSEEAADSQPEDEFVPELDMDERYKKMYGPPKYKLKKNEEGTINVEFESLDYNVPNNRIRKEWLAVEGNGEPPSALQRAQACIVIGIFVGLTAFLIFFLIDRFSEIKYNFLEKQFDRKPHNLGRDSIGMGFAIIINAFICLIAVVLGVLSPVSCGSGIPHIKCYLNGIKIPKVLRMNTYAAKVIGIVCSVTGGLPVGKEGPMIHSGAIVGGGFSQGISTSAPYLQRFTGSIFSSFRNDKDKRDFVAAGAAAGVTAAFGAPLGGVFFALEEGLSHFNETVIMQCLCTSAVCYLVLSRLMSWYLGEKFQGDGALFTFGKIEDSIHLGVIQCVVFALIGVLGGLLGAVWNEINKFITKYRLCQVRSRLRKHVEVVSWSILLTVIAYISMSFSSECHPDGLAKTVDKFPVQLFCEDGTFHAVSALWFQTPENVVKEMIHSPTFYYSLWSLSMFLAIYFIIACVTYGLNISSGLFVPNLLVGALWGRMIGIVLLELFPEEDIGPVGLYALMGAAAQLSGIVRMTFSLTAILVEATGGYNLTVPMFLVVLISKFVSQAFNHGIYEIHMELAGVPFLNAKAPKTCSKYKPKDVMATPVICLERQCNVRQVHNVLLNTTHNLFPVVDELVKPEEGQQRIKTFGKLLGVIPRDYLSIKMYYNFYANRQQDPDLQPKAVETWERFIDFYPRSFLWAENLQGIPQVNQEQILIDLNNVVCSDYYACNYQASLEKVYEDFRGSGARHMIVTSHDNSVLGIITRKDLAMLHYCEKKRELQLKSWIIPGEGTSYPKSLNVLRPEQEENNQDSESVIV